MRAADRAADASGAPAGPAVHGGAGLAGDEVDAYTRALVGRSPTAYVRAQYLRAHDHLPLDPAGAFDEALVEFAALHPVATRAADAYARLLLPGATLRRKLGVLAAILESTAPYDAGFAPTPRSVPGVLAALAVTGAGFALALALGLLVLTPVRVVTALEGEPP